MSQDELAPSVSRHEPSAIHLPQKRRTHPRLGEDLPDVLTTSVARVAIAFGSNMGDRCGIIHSAIEATPTWGTLIAVSGLYESDPMYIVDQTPFINGVLLAETSLAPSELLASHKSIETKLGRIQREQNGPREIDLDIIWYEGYNSKAGETPQIPHPRAHERRFVLEPLNEIAPELLLQGYGVVRDLLMDYGVQSQKVRRVQDAPILI